MCNSMTENVVNQDIVDDAKFLSMRAVIAALSKSSITASCSRRCIRA